MTKNFTSFVIQCPFYKWLFVFLPLFSANLVWGQTISIDEAPTLNLDPLNLLESCWKSGSFTISGENLSDAEFIQVSIDNPKFTLDAETDLPRTNLISVPVTDLPATIHFTYTPNTNSSDNSSATVTVIYNDGLNNLSTQLTLSATTLAPIKGVSLFSPILLPPTNVTDTTVTFNWTKVIADSLTLRVYTKDQFGEKVFLSGFPIGFNSSNVLSYTLKGLKEGMYYSIQSHAKTKCKIETSSCLTSWRINGGACGSYYCLGFSVVNNSKIYKCILADRENSLSDGEPDVGSNWQTYWIEELIYSYGSMCKPIWNINGNSIECPEIIGFYCEKDTVINSVDGFVSHCVDGIFQTFPAIFNYRYKCINANKANAQSIGEPGVGGNWQIYWNPLGFCSGGGIGGIGVVSDGWVDSDEQEGYFEPPSPPTSIENKVLSRVVYSIGNEVIVNAVKGEIIDIFNPVGQKIMSYTTTEGENRITVHYQGVLIVRIGSEITKVVVR